MRQKRILWVLLIVWIYQFNSIAQQIIDTTKYDCSIVKNSLKHDTLEEVVFCAERMPGIKGGNKQLEKNLIYNDSIERNKYSGTVYLGFIVTAEGKKECIKVIKGVSSLMDKEALRILSQLEFDPALQGGKPIPCVYHLPIDFNKATVLRKKKQVHK
jgi:protein TonB